MCDPCIVAYLVLLVKPWLNLLVLLGLGHAPSATNLFVIDMSNMHHHHYGQVPAKTLFVVFSSRRLFKIFLSKGFEKDLHGNR